MQKQMGSLMHASDISNVRRTELARKVATIMPKGLRNNCISYFTQSGSGAVETAIKFVRKITGRSQIAAFHGAYHGVWCGCNSLTTGDQYRKGFGPFIPGVIHLPYPILLPLLFRPGLSELQAAVRPVCGLRPEHPIYRRGRCGSRDHRGPAG